MNENHSAENNPASSDSDSGANNWYSGWEDFSGMTAAEPDVGTADIAATDIAATDVAATAAFPGAVEAVAEEDVWQTVTPPRAVSVDDLVQDAQRMVQGKAQGKGDRPSTPLNAPRSTSHDTKIDLPDWSVRTFEPQGSAPKFAQESAVRNAPAPAEEPQDAPLDVPELVSLIQELNQCNSALLDRVTSLEDALEQAKQVARREAMAAPGMADGAVPSAQMMQLFQELESAQQTGQRQQILIENLHSQLAYGQQRIAQLEQTCTTLHQHQTEYQQQLAQRDHACRDLQVRLQRQQRYTLQFKAALEQCLEMTSLPHDMPILEEDPGLGAIAPSGLAPVSPAPSTASFPPAPMLAPQLLTPKVRQIQPWSAQASATGLPTKLDGLLGQALAPDAAEAELAGGHMMEGAIAPHAFDGFDQPIPPDGTPRPLAATERPTADVDPELQASSNALQAAAAELQSLLGNLFNPQAEGNTIGSEVPVAGTSIWQNLARLVDISPADSMAEEEAQASQAQDPTAGVAPAPPVAPASTVRPTLSMPLDFFRQKGTLPPQPAASSPVAPFQPGNPVPPPTAQAAQPVNGTPSPIVYPLRPQKKIDSLAAVDLPSFPS